MVEKHLQEICRHEIICFSIKLLFLILLSLIWYRSVSLYSFDHSLMIMRIQALVQFTEVLPVTGLKVQINHLCWNTLRGCLWILNTEFLCTEAAVIIGVKHSAMSAELGSYSGIVLHMQMTLLYGILCVIFKLLLTLALLSWVVWNETMY